MAKANTRKKPSASSAKKKTIVAKKPAAKKPAPKKPVAKKPAAPKAAAKKAAKPVTKKLAKPVAKKAAPAKAKTTAKKPVTKTVAKPVKKSTPAPAKKLAAAVKPSKPVAAARPTPQAKKPVASMTKPASKTAAPVKAAAPVPPKPKKPISAYKPVPLPAGYKPTEKEEYMSPQQVEYFRQKLLAWRNELLAESRETLEHLHEEDWHQADIADRASLETEAGVELRTRNRYLKLISKIDAALQRIAEGEYGYCEETGEPIGIKRLEARPVATLSIEAQERHEKMEKQYTDDD